MRKGGCRLYWSDAAGGWVIDVPTTISADQVRRVARWAYEQQYDRLLSLPHGDRRSELGRRMAPLAEGKLTQNLVDSDRDGVWVPFASTEKATDTHYSFGSK